jgi:hypothetical protein
MVLVVGLGHCLVCSWMVCLCLLHGELCVFVACYRSQVYLQLFCVDYQIIESCI